MTDRRYIEVKFRPEDSRAYTYHYDGDGEIEAGMRAIVNASGEEKQVTVTRVLPDAAPEFETKPLLAIVAKGGE